MSSISLQSEYPAPPDQIAALSEKLRKGTNRHYAGFLQTLRETDQGAIVSDILGEDPSLDKEQMVSTLVADIDNSMSSCIKHKTYKS